MPIPLQITISIAVALILVPLGKRLGIVTILGYLLTGILVGPNVLNIVNDPQQIMTLAEYGIIILMFLLGLELRPQRIWHMRHVIFVLGGLQMAVTGSIFMLLLWSLFSLSLSASLVIGFALALSSTAFVLQLLGDRQQLQSFYGQKSFSILLFQNIAAMFLLAIIPLLAGHYSVDHGIAYFAAVIATFSGLFLFSRYILRPLFRFVAKNGATELLTAVGLFTLLAVIIVMDAVGISTTLAAFLAGMLLADSEFRHELENSIQPFKGLLLGLFFMTVGIGISFNTVIEQPLLIIGSSILFVLIKLVCVIAIAYLQKQQLANSVRLGIILAQGGEFAFIIFAVAMTENIISSELLTPLILIVSFSMLITPILLWILDRYLEPIFQQSNQAKDEDLPQQQQHIVIAGFGRFGQIIARIAHLQHIPFTIIDNNIDHIDFVHKYGGHVYYADATVPETLQSVQLSSAKLLVLAIDDVENSMNIARYAKLHYPELIILARARDRHHVHLLKELNIQYIWRETYLAALAMAEHMLSSYGMDEHVAKQYIQDFSKYDEELLQRQQGIFADPQKLLESPHEMLQELENLFENDSFVQTQHQPSKHHQDVP